VDPAAPWWKDLEAAVREHCAAEAASPPPSVRSSVAALLDLSGPPRVLLMKRVELDRDPWSGHVSLPGGRRSPADADLLDTAVRETREEVGIDLTTRSRLIARMGAIRTHIRSIDVTPFVFAFEDDTEPAAGPEAEALFWFPLDLAASGALDGEFRWDQGQVVRRMPCWNHAGFVVWGLTYRILKELIEIGRARA
jgi:8-oxo-dGTP pyrophosphatase MutT (NUDIX family)